MSSSASTAANNPSRTEARGGAVSGASPSFVFRLRAAARKFHFWLAWAAAAPALIILVTGIALQLRQDIEWIQPKPVSGTKVGIPSLPLTEAFERAASLPAAGIRSWEDVASIDVKPSKGLISIRTREGYEVQLDGTSGEVLSAAPRRTGLLIELHQGSYFHAAAMRWVFFPTGVALLFLWATGMVMAFRRRKQSRSVK